MQVAGRARTCWWPWRMPGFMMSSMNRKLEAEHQIVVWERDGQWWNAGHGWRRR